ncbi:hypothetical protein M1328_05660 [Patescibacteria group bacterium]|nr:hypothetical protein [Patescibacteria group bacterium]
MTTLTTNEKRAVIALALAGIIELVAAIVGALADQNSQPIIFIVAFVVMVIKFVVMGVWLWKTTMGSNQRRKLGLYFVTWFCVLSLVLALAQFIMVGIPGSVILIASVVLLGVYFVADAIVAYFVIKH